MSVVDKLIDAFRLDDPDDGYDGYDDDYDDEYEEKAEKKKHLFKKADSDDDDVEDEGKKRPAVRESQKITPMRSKKTAAVTSEVCVIKPTSFEEVTDIAETLLCNRTVVLNMEGMDLAIGQRIIDFMSGACYAIDGNLQKISNYIFIVTPKNVDISGDLQGIMDSFELNGLKTGF